MRKLGGGLSAVGHDREHHPDRVARVPRNFARRRLCPYKSSVAFASCAAAGLTGLDVAAAVNQQGGEVVPPYETTFETHPQIGGFLRAEFLRSIAETFSGIRRASGWVRPKVDAGARPGTTTEESAEREKPNCEGLTRF